MGSTLRDSLCLRACTLLERSKPDFESRSFDLLSLERISLNL